MDYKNFSYLDKKGRKEVANLFYKEADRLDGEDKNGANFYLQLKRDLYLSK